MTSPVDGGSGWEPHLRAALAVVVCAAALLAPELGRNARAASGEAGAAVAEEVAVILSPGPTPGVAWGGYHITITGYSRLHACLLGPPSCETLLRADFRDGFHGRPWHLHGHLPRLVQWKGVWTQTLDSDTLDDLAADLHRQGFEKIKGPAASAVDWHISLGSDEVAARAQVKVLRGEDWYLWLVPQSGDACHTHGVSCPAWTLISTSPTPTPSPSPTPPPPPCLGDCDSSGQVTVDDIVLVVNIANGIAPISACPAVDPDHTGTVTIERIVAVVHNALVGCSP